MHDVNLLRQCAKLYALHNLIKAFCILEALHKQVSLGITCKASMISVLNEAWRALTCAQYMRT